MEHCSICGDARNLDRHHIRPRQMGGSRKASILARENLITLCRKCHAKIHEGGWDVRCDEELLEVIDRRTGAQVMRRLRDVGFDAPQFFQMLNVIELALGNVLRQVPYLSDEQLVETFQSSRGLGKRSWIIQAAVLHEAQRRSVYGDRALEAIAKRFEISLNMAEKYAKVWREFFADEDHGQIFNVEEIQFQEVSWYIVAATESPEPRKWLAYAADRKAETPSYSISDFRVDIQAAEWATLSHIEQAAGRVSAGADAVRWDCPWVRPYCLRSGIPVPASDCACDGAA